MSEEKRDSRLHLVTRSDVTRLYDLLLGRAPESEQAISEKVGVNVFDLILDMTQSEEFKHRVFTPAVAHSSENWVRRSFDDDARLWLNDVLSLELKHPTGLAELLLALAAIPASDASEGCAVSKLMSLATALSTVSGRGIPDPSTLNDRDLVLDSGLWDASFYVEQMGSRVGEDPVDRFLSTADVKDPHPLFRSEYYLAANPDVRSAGCNPLVHYLRHGEAEDRWPNPLFSPDWYRRAHHLSPERRALAHYANSAVRRAVKPHPLFDGETYLERYPDVQLSGSDPYVHYIRHGFAEGRILPPPRSGPSLRTAVVVHVFYAELWPELLWRLHGVDASYSLYVTVPEANADLRARIATDRPDALVLPVANRGRDLGALLAVWPLLERDGIDLVCKVHSKRGGTEPDTWRHIALEGVLGTGVFQKIQEHFKQDVFLTLVGAQQTYLDGERWTNRDERFHLLEMLRACGVQEMVPATVAWGFFAGSCFWMRLSAFRSIRSLAVGMGEADNLEREGQWAHALERIFGALAAQRADRVGFTDMSGPRVSGALTVRRAPGPSFGDDFPAYLRRRTQELASVKAEVPARQRRAWTVPPDRSPGVSFIGPVEAVNGLGVSARGFVRAFRAAGIPINVTPWRLGFDRIRHKAFDAPHLGPQPINIVHLNLDLIYTGKLLEREPLLHLIHDKCFNVLIISWELLSLPTEWTAVLDAFDEVWASSRFMVTGVRSASRTPVRVVRPALVDPPSVPPLPLAPGRFLFGYIADSGSLLQRKNPERLWRTYSETFGPKDGAALVIKLHYPVVENPLFQEVRALARSREDIILISDSLSEASLAALVRRIDAYVSPHRSEGLGLTIIEAMMAGKPVICTDFGGCTEFADASTAFPVARHLMRVGEGAAPYPANAVWADPQADSLAEQMRHVFHNQAAAMAVASEGCKRVHDMFGANAAAEGLRAELRRIWRAGGGSDLPLDLSLFGKDR